MTQSLWPVEGDLAAHPESALRPIWLANPCCVQA